MLQYDGLYLLENDNLTFLLFYQIIMSKMLLPTLNLVLLLPLLCTCQLKVMVITEPAQQDAFTAATEGIAKAQTDNGDTITIDIENVKVYFFRIFCILFTIYFIVSLFLDRQR